MSSVKSGATHRCKKVFQRGLSLFRRGFNPSECKTMAKMAVARVKLLRNKREVVIKQMRRDIATLLESGQDSTARIRVEHVIREHNIMAANELIELFCELIVSRLSIIAKQKECPADLKEGISSLIFAAPRCSDIPELLSIQEFFQKKYGKDFVSSATELRSNAGVNHMLIEKLSVKAPLGEIKLKILKEIAKEYRVQWDTKESEEELLKSRDELIEGPEKFVSATSLPLKPVEKQYPEPTNPTSDSRPINITTFQSLASAAGIAAKNALAAAEAANVVHANAVSRNEKFFPTSQADDRRVMRTNSSEYSHCEQRIGDDDGKVFRTQSYNCQRAYAGISFDESDCDEEIEMEEQPSSEPRKTAKMHSCNVAPPTKSSDVRYDESGGEEDIEELDIRPTSVTHLPPNRPAPQVPVRCVHPKLPDYDAFAARLGALKPHNTLAK